jgi:outer membrane immunogenic protein
MKKLVLAILGLAGFATSAVAADIAAQPVYKAPPVAAPVYSWSGCYLGAGGGYGFFREDITSLVNGTVFVPKQNFSGSGWFGTVQGGCDYQFASNWVIGAFADYDFGSIKGDVSYFGGDFGTEKLNWSWAAGGRIGYLPFDRLMVYVSAGGTQAHFKQVDLFNAAGASLNASLQARTVTGWFVGTGYEYGLGFLPGLFWKSEYRFADYGKHTDTLLFAGVPFPPFTVDRHPFVHTIRSELVWRFNWGR